MALDKPVYTIDRIAQELGVSKATVSRALSGKGNLSEQTRRRILDFAQAHNYRPNAVAQSLARSRTCNLGVMLPSQSGILDGAFFSECLQGICGTVAAIGCAYTSAAAFKFARQEKKTGIMVTGILGTLMGLLFLVLLLVPGLSCSLGKESCICLIIWAIPGVAFYPNSRKKAAK